MTLTIAIRADASASIGFGHVMRCLALADRLSRGGAECHFICKDPGQPIASLPGAANHVWHIIEDENDTVMALRKLKPHWLIVDHYGIDEVHETRWRLAAAGAKLLVIDDLADRHHDCDLLLDVTPGRVQADYSELISNQAVALLGANYALLRPEFAQRRELTLARRANVEEARKLLITLGGGDTSAALAIVAEALQLIEFPADFRIAVIGGGTVALEMEQSLPVSVEIVGKTDRMADYIAEADLAIGAAGGTSWERCCLGLPCVVLQIADNQANNAEFLARSGAARVVEKDAGAIAAALNRLLQSREMRDKISHTAADVCDGQGAKRVAAKIAAMSMNIRTADMSDAEFIYNARYGGDAARYYKSTEVPAFESHLEWFQRALQAEDRDLLIVALGDEDIAHVRFDALEGDGHAEIGIALAPDYRGMGLSVPVLESTCSEFFANGGAVINAEVDPENIASMRLFEEAGFDSKGFADSGLIQFVRNG